MGHGALIIGEDPVALPSGFLPMANPAIQLPLTVCVRLPEPCECVYTYRNLLSHLVINKLHTFTLI